MQDAALVLEGSQASLAEVLTPATGSALDLVLELEYEEIIFRITTDRTTIANRINPLYLVSLATLP